MAVEDLLHPWLEAYFASPQWVKNSVGRAYSLFAGPLRKGRDHHRFQREAAVRDPVVLERLVTGKLRDALRHALETVPAYADYRHLLSALDSPRTVLRQLPLIAKEEIRRDPNRFLSSQAAVGDRLKVSTGGTTAVPLVFYLQKGVTRSREYAYIQEFHHRAGLTESEIVLALRGRTVPTAKRAQGPLWMFEPIKRELIISTEHLARQHMPAYIDAIRAWKPTFIQAYPSAIFPLARWLQEHPAPDVVQRIRAVMLFSESVLDQHLQLLQAVFPCPILQHYGQSERILMAASMPNDGRSFFYPQYGHLELVDHRGATIDEPGVLGEIVGTGFDNQVMPFIRYRTGDMAMLGVGEHPSLPGYPVVERIEGRRQEFIVCSDRRLISINALTTTRYPDLETAEAIQFEQTIPGQFTVKVRSATPLSAAAAQRVVRAMAAKTGDGCLATVTHVEHIARTARGKHQMLIQHLDLSPYFGALGPSPANIETASFGSNKFGSVNLGSSGSNSATSIATINEVLP